MRLLFIFVLALSLHMLAAEAQNVAKEPSLVEKMRPTLMKIVGEKWTEKLIGAAPVEVVNTDIILPAIPKVLKDAKSTAVFDKKADKVVLSPKIENDYYYSYIMEIYNATRLTKPNDDEIAKMVNILSQGGTREGVYHQLVLDSTYGGMENYDKPIKSNAADFAVYFYAKYLGKKIDKQSLKGMNFFTVKRLMADNALDVLDAFGDNRDDLEKWYAVFSGELAAKFPMVWTSKLRTDSNSKRHKLWASKVPLQHIKSETLIKLHTAMNSLM